MTLNYLEACNDYCRGTPVRRFLANCIACHRCMRTYNRTLITHAKNCKKLNAMIEASKRKQVLIVASVAR